MINVIGYGSLMIPESLQKTVSAKKVKLIWVQGYRRICNIKSGLLKMYKVREQDNHVAILNVEEQPGAKLNAAMFDATEAEYEKLKIREKIYYTKEVAVQDFMTGEEVGTAVLFIGRKLAHGERIVSNEYLPIDSYCARCRQAAYDFSGEFGKAYDETTFAADGKKMLD
ncbi:MAG: hypothetical protein V1837_00285 [Candidatus Woesearchaeota archaeon]